MRITSIAAAAAAVLLASCGGNGAPVPGARNTTKIAAATPPPAPPTPRIAPRQRDCIATAVWHEAGGEPLEGQVAVAEVILTRAGSGLWPRTPCGVVRQPHQFSFVHGGDIGRVPREYAGRIHDLVEDVVAGRLRSRVRGAVGFHTVEVSDNWRRRFAGRIGGHLFFAEILSDGAGAT